MSDAAALRQRSPVVLADLLPGSLVRDTILVVGAAGFVGLLAQISIHLSFTPVPITGQTLGVLLAAWHLEEWPRRLLAAIEELNMRSLDVQLLRFAHCRPKSVALLGTMPGTRSGHLSMGWHALRTFS